MALLGLGTSYFALQRWREAAEHLAPAMAWLHSQGETVDEACILENLGVCYLSIAGMDQRGIDLLGEALALFRYLGNQHEQAKTLTNLGMAYLQHRSSRSRGLQQGLAYLVEAEAIARAVDDRELLGTILETQGRLKERLGSQHEALSAFQRASALDPHTRPVERLQSIGRIYQQLGHHASALEYDTKALLKAFTLGDVVKYG